MKEIDLAELFNIVEERIKAVGSAEAGTKAVETSKPKKTGKKNNNGYIYLFESCQWTKIGKAKNVLRQLKKSQVDNPERIKLVHMIACENMHSAEEKIHKQYAKKREFGNWFHLSDDDLDDIKEIVMIKD